MSNLVRDRSIKVTHWMRYGLKARWSSPCNPVL